MGRKEGRRRGRKGEREEKEKKKEMKIRLATRESELAMWQARHAASLLREAPGVESVEVCGMKTHGDKVQDRPLSSFASKGIFTKEVDEALLAGRADVAVHCVKDLPTVLPPGLKVAAFMDRGDPWDAVVLRDPSLWDGRGGTCGLDALPDGAVVGTSALRRRASLALSHPRLVCRDVRGNVQTRLAKLDAGGYDALILAMAGLQRCGLDARTQGGPPRRLGHAVGQGALAVVVREDAPAGLLAACARLHHTGTAREVAGERALLRALEGGCKVPIAVRWDGDTLHCLVTSVDGSRSAADSLEPGGGADPEAGDDAVLAELFACVDAGVASDADRAAARLGVALARRAAAGGAMEILADIRAKEGGK